MSYSPQNLKPVKPSPNKPRMSRGANNSAPVSWQRLVNGSINLPLLSEIDWPAQAEQPTTRAESDPRPPSVVLRDRLAAQVAIPDGVRHQSFWQWLDAITDDKPPAYIGNWPRGGAKSTCAELAAAACALTLRRRFVLYVSGTQQQADMHLATVAAYLEMAGEARAVNAYGYSKGWTGQMLRTARGFNALSIGLDGNVRGAKLDELRPDLIILDDVDARFDSAATVKKKSDTIFQTILPAGASNAAVLFVQNKIHAKSVMAQLLDGTLEALLTRVVTDEPAVIGLEYERRERADGTPYYAVTGGDPTWPEGQGLGVVEAQMNEWGLTAVLSESQHMVDEPDGGMFSHLVYRRVTWHEVPALIRTAVWCDPAVTATDQSDCNGIQADGVGTDGLLYRLWSWEQRSTPQETLCRAIIKAVELGALVVGVETDQGGETWRSVFLEAMRQLTADDDALTPEELTPAMQRFRAQFAAARGSRGDAYRAPVFRSAKAGSSAMSKTERAARMLSAYERGKIVHVQGTHAVLESALRRFPVAKPYDLTDAAYWSWQDLTGGSSSNSAVGAFG